jgi:hypothetical protein
MPRFIPIILQVQGAEQGQTVVSNLGNAFKQLDQNASQAGSGGLSTASHGMTSAFLAAELLQEGLHKVFDFFKEAIVETALFAGRTEELTIALHQLAKANGISTDSIDKQLNGLIGLNIARQEATQILSQMIGANLDLSKATTLARVAQDTAVVSGKNSSEAFVDLTNAILLGNTEAFRSAGIFLSVGDALEKGAKALGLNKDALSEQQRTQILTNAVIEYGTRVTGTYEAAMGSASKQMRSLTRIHDDAKEAVGGLFQGAFSIGVKVAAELLKLIVAYPASFLALTAAVLTLSASLVFYNTNLIPSLIAKGAGLIGMFQNLVFWTVNWRVALTDAQVATSLLTGWAAVAIAIGVVVVALTNQASAAEAANKITLEQVEHQKAAWESSKTLAAAASDVANAQGDSAEQHQQLNTILNQLDPTTRAYIESLNTERDRIAALNAELERNAALHRVPLVASLRVEGGGILEQMSDIEAASARIAGIEEQIRREQELLASDPSWAEKLRPAIQNLSTDIVAQQQARDDLSKALKENEAKFIANTNALGLNRDQMLLLFQQAGHTAPEVAKLAEVYDRLTGRTNETTEALKGQALALRDVKKELDALLKTGMAEIDSKVLDIVKQARERGLSAAEAKRIAQDASGSGTVLGKLIRDRKEITDTEKAVRGVFEPKPETRGAADRAEREQGLIRSMKDFGADLADAFKEEFGKNLLMRVGQTDFHAKKLHLDHRAAIDIPGLDPRTAEGRFVQEFAEEHGVKIWFAPGPMTRDGKVISTSKHGHLGEFSRGVGKPLRLPEGLQSEGLLSAKGLQRYLEEESLVFAPWSGKMVTQQEYDKQISVNQKSHEQLTTTETPETRLPIEIQRQWDLYYKEAGDREKALHDRRADFAVEYETTQRNMLTDIGNLELDLAHLRAQSADDQFTEQRRLLAARGEEYDLLKQLQQAQDDIANGPYNQSLRIQLALLHDIADIRRRDEDAIKDQNRARLELADATIYHAAQADASVLKFLASQRTVTQVIADAKVGVIQSTFDLIDRGLDKATSKLGMMSSLVKDLLSGFIRLALSKFFQTTMGGPGTAGGSPASGGGIGSFLGNLLGIGSRGGSAQAALTGGFAGGPGGGSFFGGGNITSPGGAQAAALAGIFGGGGITAPASLSSQQGQQTIAQIAAMAQGNVTGGASGAAGAFSLSGLGASLGPLLPLLGLAGGASLGGQSRFGSVLGGIGGLAAGGIGAAFLGGGFLGASVGNGIFAAGGLFGSMGPAIAGLLTNPFTIAAAGALIVGALILRKSAERKAQEKIRDSASVGTLGDVYKLLFAARDGGVTLAEAQVQWEQIHQQYLGSIAGIKDSKTRDHALKWWDYISGTKADPGGATVAIWPQIEAAALKGQKAKDIERHLVPEFAMGGMVPRGNTLFSMVTGLTPIKVRPGEVMIPPGGFGVTVPGVDRGYDSVFTMAPPRTRVLTKSQQAGAQGFSNGGTVGGGGDGGALAPIVIEEVTVDIDAEGIVRVGMKARGNRDVFIKTVRDARLNKEL